jgi:hypothetical protein
MAYTPREFPRIGRGVSRFVTEEYRNIAQNLKRFANGVLSLRDSNDSHDLTIELGSDLTDSRTLTLEVPDADTSFEITGDTVIEGTHSGTNTGDQTITLTGDVTGTGTGSFAATIGNDKVTYAKMQDVSATDKLLGRSTSGAGDVEEIPCTAAGRALLDDADAAAQRTTLTAATKTQTDFISGIIKTPAAQDYNIVEELPYGATLIGFHAKTLSGTVTAALKINSTAVTDGSINVTSSQGNTTPSALNVAAPGDTLVLTCSSVSSAVDLSFTIKFTRTLD